MTEDLLVFVSIIAVWKIVQVWFLKANIKAKERQIAAVKGEIDRLSTEFEDVKQSLHRYRSHYGPTAFRDSESDWPEIVNRD